MTTIREAAQQALEALEDHAKQYPHMQKGYTVDAITALRAALAQQDEPCPTQRKPVVSVDELANHIRVVDGNHSLGAGALAEKIVEFLIERGISKESCDAGPRAALAQQDEATGKSFLQVAPVQEPVALETVYGTIIHWDEGGGKRSRRELARRIVDLYTTPPQRKPLTEEEIDAEWRELDGEVSPMFMRVLRKFARAVERAHGIVTCGDTKERA